MNENDKDRKVLFVWVIAIVVGVIVACGGNWLLTWALNEDEGASAATGLLTGITGVAVMGFILFRWFGDDL